MHLLISWVTYYFYIYFEILFNIHNQRLLNSTIMHLEEEADDDDA